ncbi:hypothetical protein ABK040_006039 [Willaertia magna]
MKSTDKNKKRNQRVHVFVDETINVSSKGTNSKGANNSLSVEVGYGRKLRKPLKNNELLKNYFEWNKNNKLDNSAMTVHQYKMYEVLEKDSKKENTTGVQNNNTFLTTNTSPTRSNHSLPATVNNHEINNEKQDQVELLLKDENNVLISEELKLRLDLNDFIKSLMEESKKQEKL